MYMNISNKQDCAVTEHLCLERIHCPSHLSRFKYFFLPITSLVCVEREYKTCILLVESFCFLSGCHHARDYPCRTGVFVWYDCMVYNGRNLCHHFSYVYIYIYVNIYIYVCIHICIWLRPCFHRAPVLGQNLLNVDSVKLQISPSRHLQLLVHVMKVDTRPLFHGGCRCVFCEVVTINTPR